MEFLVDLGTGSYFEALNAYGSGGETATTRSMVSYEGSLKSGRSLGSLRPLFSYAGRSRYTPVKCIFVSVKV